MSARGSDDRRVAFSVAVLLTWVAGVVDAIGFLSFARIYMANMSGNSIALGIAIGELNWQTAFFRFWPVLFYVLGLLLGRLILEIGARSRIGRIASFVFLLECLLLAVTAFMGTASFPFLPIASLALAMGAQNAALTRFSSLTLHTGFVTGTLLKASAEFVKVITWVWDRIDEGRRVTDTLKEAMQQDSFRLSLFLWITWLAYVVGAAVGAVGMKAVKTNALLVAVAGLVLLICVDVRAPLAVQDESQQNKGA